MTLNRSRFAVRPICMGIRAQKLEERDPVVQRGSAAASRPTDAVLVGAARGGDRWAKEALFRRHAPLAMGLAYRLLGSDADLEDVVQEAYFQALDKLHRLQDPQAFAAWLAGIIVRRVQQLLRHRRLLGRLGLRHPVPIDPDLSLASTTPPEVVAELARIYAVVEKLSTQARLVLLLRRVDGYSLPEIATMLSCSLSTAKRRMLEAERVLLAYHQEGA